MSSGPEGSRQGRRAAAAMTVAGGAALCFVPFPIVTIPLGIILIVTGLRNWRASGDP